MASSHDELKRLLAGAQRRLIDAAADNTSNEARTEHSYHVILQCAVAALRANDYRGDGSEGKHVLSLNTLEHTLGLEPKLIRYFQKLRQRRHIDLYEGDAPVSDNEMLEAISAAAELLDQTRQYIRQLRLEFGG